MDYEKCYYNLASITLSSQFPETKQNWCPMTDMTNHGHDLI